MPPEFENGMKFLRWEFHVTKFYRLGAVWTRNRKSFITVWRNILTVTNIVNRNQGKVKKVKKKTNKLETDIELASCEQLQTVFILCPQSFVPESCERGLMTRR